MSLALPCNHYTGGGGVLTDSGGSLKFLCMETAILGEPKYLLRDPDPTSYNLQK